MLHSPSPILQLQSRIGNQAAQRLFHSHPELLSRRASTLLRPLSTSPYGNRIATASAPLKYDRTPVQIGLPPTGLQAAGVTKQLDTKKQAGDIASYGVLGVRAGSNAEIFLLSILFAMGKRNRWGTEADIVTAIDWPPKGGGPAPQGRVTVRIDDRGNATAELIAAGPVPAVAQSTVVDASAKLISDFGFAAVTGFSGRGARDDIEISDVLAALNLLRTRAPNDVAALRGVELIRVSSLGGTTAGEFAMGGDASGGANARTRPTLKLADRAFAANDVQFMGGGPASPTVPSSFETILHEVGHAVEKEQLRSAYEAYVTASEDQQTAKTATATYDATYQAEFDEAKRKGKLKEFYNKRAKEHKRLEDAESQAATRSATQAGNIDQMRVGATTVQPLQQNASNANAAAANALTTAKSSVQALAAPAAQGAAPVVQALDDTAAAIATFAADAKIGTRPTDDLESVVQGKVRDRDRVRGQLPKAHPALAQLDASIQAQDAWFWAERVLARGRLRTNRLQKFIDLVNTNNIKPFTQYAADNWPLKPEEFYAEAYSLWMTDSNFLKTNYRLVFDFFSGGTYRQ